MELRDILATLILNGYTVGQANGINKYKVTSKDGLRKYEIGIYQFDSSEFWSIGQVDNFGNNSNWINKPIKFKEKNITPSNILF